MWQILPYYIAPYLTRNSDVWDHSFQLAFSKSAEFMETGQDVDGIIHSLERMHRYVTIIGQLPFRMSNSPLQL